LKTAATQRSAELLAEFEQQLASVYSYDQHRTWKAATEAAGKAVSKAKKQIAARCEELGIPARFAPTVEYLWSGRGENAVAERRRELRAVAKMRETRHRETRHRECWGSPPTARICSSISMMIGRPDTLDGRKSLR
jgi:hypothetical protein